MGLNAVSGGIQPGLSRVKGILHTGRGCLRLRLLQQLVKPLDKRYLPGTDGVFRRIQLPQSLIQFVQQRFPLGNVGIAHQLGNGELRGPVIARHVGANMGKISVKNLCSPGIFE